MVFDMPPDNYFDMTVVTYLDIRFQILILKKIYLFTTLLQQQKVTAKYSNICCISSQFCSKKELLFLEQNRPDIQRILAYFAVTFLLPQWGSSYKDR
jgi:hypothetical protein